MHPFVCNAGTKRKRMKHWKRNCTRNPWKMCLLPFSNLFRNLDLAQHFHLQLSRFPWHLTIFFLSNLLFLFFPIFLCRFCSLSFNFRFILFIQLVPTTGFPYHEMRQTNRKHYYLCKQATVLYFNFHFILLHRTMLLMLLLLILRL